MELISKEEVIKILGRNQAATAGELLSEIDRIPVVEQADVIGLCEVVRETLRLSNAKEGIGRTGDSQLDLKKWQEYLADKKENLILLHDMLDKIEKELPTWYVPRWIAQRVIAARDANVEKDYNEVYHQLYTIADPEFSKFADDTWKDLESLGK